MLNELLLHPVTREALLAIVQRQPHAVLLKGPRGSGKGFTATVLAADFLGCLPAELESQPYFLHILPENDSIKIEQVRELKQFMQLKTTGRAQIRRVVIIEDIMLMGDEAQNALLKLLEEPPADTILILTSTNSPVVRPTILSRVQTVVIQAPAEAQCEQYFVAKGYDPTDISKAYAVSRGAAGLLQALLDAQDHPLLEHIELAKQLLGASKFDRLSQVEKLSKDRAGIEALLEALNSICSAALQQTARANNLQKLQRWYRSLKAVDAATNALKSRPSNKLLLTNLFLEL